MSPFDFILFSTNLPGRLLNKGDYAMRASCLICNYNYGAFVLEAVESALAQTRPFHEIIVVDDGSTDNSWALLEEQYGANSQVKLIKKSNGGQLSGFNTGYSHFSGDILFLLDSDDTYSPQYLMQALSFYEQNQLCDVLITGRHLFGLIEKDWLRFGKFDRDLGYSAVLTYGREVYVGDAASTLSFKRTILERFMPLPFEADWRLHADDAILWASALAGAHKFYLSKPLINYRIHQNNNFAGREQSSLKKYQLAMAAARLINKLAVDLNLDCRIMRLAAYEFRTIVKPPFKWCLRYLKLVARSHLSMGDKLDQSQQIVCSYLQNSMAYKRGIG